MNIDFPDLDYESKMWTDQQQLNKISEEFQEVVEAVAEQKPVQIIRESLDLMQTCVTLINMQLDTYGMKLDKFLVEHKDKLIRKGYYEEKVQAQG